MKSNLQYGVAQLISAKFDPVQQFIFLLPNRGHKDYIHSLLPTENRSKAESHDKTRNAQMLVTKILSVP